jgi:hypothetical protein
MYVKRNIGAGSCDYFCSRKAINITYSECVYVALGQYAMSMRHVVICGLSSSALYFHVISQTARFSKRNFFLDIKYALFRADRRTQTRRS